MTAVAEYQDAAAELAAQVAREALNAYSALGDGVVPPDTAVALIAAAINRGTAAAVGLADAWLAVQIEELTGQPVPAVGVLPVDSSERLTKAAATALSDAIPDLSAGTSPVAGDSDAATADLSGVNAPEMRVERLARSEVLKAAQQGAHQALGRQPLVSGWVREFDADPCQLCRWWSRDGRVWPAEHPFQSHQGCNCQPRVVVATSIRSTAYTRRLERNRR